MTKFSLGDVRITTRVDEHDLGNALFSTMHESGHAMYEQGINLAYEATPLGWGASAGVHESQSRLWENQVGRSRAFWAHYYPALQETFPGALDDVSLDQFYRAINKVERSLIRTEADEVTYNLHVMLRFDLELELLEGKLAVRDLPEAWRSRFEADMGIAVPDDRRGVLQDVHWYHGGVGGAFQGYTLGNITVRSFTTSCGSRFPVQGLRLPPPGYGAGIEDGRIYFARGNHPCCAPCRRAGAGALDGWQYLGPARTRPPADHAKRSLQDEYVGR
jgi:carboxypeptidase Taq